MCMYGCQMLDRTPDTALGVVGHVNMLVPVYNLQMIVGFKRLDRPEVPPSLGTCR
jgi:hypothetical protein